MFSSLVDKLEFMEITINLYIFMVMLTNMFRVTHHWDIKPQGYLENEFVVNAGLIELKP